MIPPVQLLGPAQYPDVRAAIAPEMADDVGAIPDSVIASDVYAGSAIRDVLAIDPLAGTRTGDELLRCQTAATLFCAARLAPRLVDIIREDIGPYTVINKARDFLALADELRYQALQLLAMNLPSVDPVKTYRPIGMVLASGCRGNVRAPTYLQPDTDAGMIGNP